MSAIVFNYTPDEIISKTHISYFTKKYTKDYETGVEVYEVVNLKLKHPEAPDLAIIETIAIEYVTKVSFNTNTSPGNASVQMFHLAHEMMHNVMQVS